MSGGDGSQVAVLVPLQLIPVERKNRLLFERFAPVCCDWMAGVHTYAKGIESRESGRMMKISADGEIEWESQSWEQIRCASSDTSLRARCDGKTLRFSGNIGRFQQADNVTGLGVVDCVERWREVLQKTGFDVTGFGEVLRKVVAPDVEILESTRQGLVLEAGTVLTRLDLAGNFEVTDYGAMCQAFLQRRIGQRLPLPGKYGPTWGYDAKRANWWKAKLYDKSAEQSGKRRSGGGKTLARFEVQIGPEWLKREKLDRVNGWKGADMAQIVYGKFAAQVFRDSVSVQSWGDVPPKYEHWLTLWREGRDLRTKMKKSQFYLVRRALMEYGIDIGVPCNVMALTRHVEVVKIMPVSALREVA